MILGIKLSNWSDLENHTQIVQINPQVLRRRNSRHQLERNLQNKKIKFERIKTESQANSYISISKLSEPTPQLHKPSLKENSRNQVARSNAFAASSGNVLSGESLK